MTLRKPCEHGRYDAHPLDWPNVPTGICPGGEFLADDNTGLLKAFDREQLHLISWLAETRLTDERELPTDANNIDLKNHANLIALQDRAEEILGMVGDGIPRAFNPEEFDTTAKPL